VKLLGIVPIPNPNRPGVFASHSVIVLRDSFGATFTMEANPQTKMFPWGLMVADNISGNAGYTQWDPTLTSSEDPGLCNQIASIETAENYYSNNEVAYNAAGPNSNSFISWLLQSGGVSQYFGGPRGSVGWNTPLYGTVWGVFPN